MKKLRDAGFTTKPRISKENTLFLLIIIVWSKQTQPRAFITFSKSPTKTQIQRDNPNLNPNLENLEI